MNGEHLKPETSRTPEKRAVYVVETYLENPGRWFVWSAHTTRPVAWRHAREARTEWPAKFRVTKYVSTKP